MKDYLKNPCPCGKVHTVSVDEVVIGSGAVKRLPDFVKKYGDRSNPWFIMLAKEDWFMDIVRRQWSEAQKDGGVYACIQEERQYLETYEEDLNRKNSSATKSARYLLNWIESRVEWLDEEWIR